MSNSDKIIFDNRIDFVQNQFTSFFYSNPKNSMLLLRNRIKLLSKSILILSMLLVSNNSPVSAAQFKSNVNSSKLANINYESVKIAGVVIKRDDLTFEYLDCKKTTDLYSNQYLSCTFKITYIGSDEMKDFSIINARAFSALDGNQYSFNNSTVGGNYSIDMISRQPVRGVINFSWSPALKRLSILEFETNNTSRKILIRYKTAQQKSLISHPN